MKKRVWEIIEVAREGDRISRVFDFGILFLIVLSIAAIVLESVAELRSSYAIPFHVLEIFCIIVFTVEYLARVWSCPSDERYSHRISGRIRFALTPLAIVDLLAILPFYLTMAGLDLRFVRAFRLFRLFRLAKLARYSRAFRLLGRVFRRSWDELAVTLVVIGVLIVTASSLMWLAEGDVQPDVFSDIPSTMWWAVVTVTTLGYGDAIPITFAGKLLAGVIALLGVGLLALPTAILGSAFVEELHGRGKRCPHCGEKLGEGEGDF